MALLVSSVYFELSVVSPSKKLTPGSLFNGYRFVKLPCKTDFQGGSFQIFVYRCTGPSRGSFVKLSSQEVSLGGISCIPGGAFLLGV